MSRRDSVAARVTFWPDCPVDKIDLCLSHTRHVPNSVRLHQRTIPADLRTAFGKGQVTSPDLTVIDLASQGCWESLCHALRIEAVTNESLAQATESLPGRPGVANRQECLRRASGNPWSVPEMELQLLFRQAGITGWAGNLPIYPGGKKVIPDVRFDASRVIAEVDSRQHHAQAGSFESDRARHNLLVAAGWTVLHFRSFVTDRSGTTVIRECDRLVRSSFADQSGGNQCWRSATSLAPTGRSRQWTMCPSSCRPER